MTVEEKIDFLCIQHLDGWSSVWAIVKSLDDVNNFLTICTENGIISQSDHIDLINYYTTCAGENINILLEGLVDES